MATHPKPGCDVSDELNLFHGRLAKRRSPTGSATAIQPARPPFEKKNFPCQALGQAGGFGLDGALPDSEPPTTAMKSRPRPGQAAESTFVVEARHAIDFANDGMPTVLATPWLIWFMEHTAREAMLPHLESNESTVGAVVEIEHLAPTPPGHAVRCRAQVLRSDGSQFLFKVEAFDEQEKIASGLHKLNVIDKARFAGRVARKAKPE